MNYGSNPQRRSRRFVGKAAKAANMVVSIGVNERDGSTLYNTQLLLDADSTLIQARRKLNPTYHERMIWAWVALPVCRL